MNAFLGAVILPSAEAAEELYDGKPGSLIKTVACTAFRALIISGGLALTGLRGKELFEKSVYSSVAVELFVVGYVIYKKQRGEA